jgi:peptidoglycan DL-endopeptidase LytF
MSRRDTIIAAVLINAGLLIILFASALKSSSGQEFSVAAPPPALQAPALAFKKAAPPLAGDEVDRALSQFSQQVAAVPTPAPSQPSVQSVQPLPTPPSPLQPPSFTEDLKAVASPPASSEAVVQNPPPQTLVVPVVPQTKAVLDFVEVKVKKGDVLEKIARYHHTTVAEIMKINQLTTTQLRIGQILKIPRKAINKAEVSPLSYSSPIAPSAPTEESAQYYVVKKGDSPWTIAVKNHMNVEDLLRLNHMSEEQARHLQPGDKLRIH